MERINKPSENIEEILDSCLKHMYNPRKQKINAAKPFIVASANEYRQLAEIGHLSDIAVHEKIGTIADKDDMLYIYEKKFRDDRENVGDYYNNIIRLANYDMCRKPSIMSTRYQNTQHFCWV